MNEPTTTPEPTMTTTTTTKPHRVRVAQPCHRCGGSGIFRPWGICFRCGGNGVDPRPAYEWVGETPAQREAREARNAAARDRAQARRQAAADAVWTTNVEALPALAEWAEDEGIMGDGFLSDVISKARRFPLSDKQRAALVAGVARRAERIAQREAEAAAAQPAPTGRVAVVGTVLTTKWTDGQFPAHKMLVAADGGFKVWATIPASIEGHYTDTDDGCGRGWIDGPDKGDRVEFTATLTPSNDDPTFAFAKRPTAAAIIERAPEQEAE